MLMSLVQWLTEIISTAMDMIINLFLSTLNLSLSGFIEAFPLFLSAYDIFRGLGMTISAVIAAFALIKVFTGGPETRMIERPVSIVVMLAVSFAWIQFGGYILEYIVRVASWSFDFFSKIPSTNLSWSQIFTGSTIASVSRLADPLMPVTDTGSAVIALVLLCAVAWNVLKLMVEVAERYLMVAVLTFTAPLIGATLPSKYTNGIFHRWLSMFFGGCLLMTFSSFFLKLILNGLIQAGTNRSLIFRMILVLAMTKVAQRVDSVMNQLGIGTAITGQSMLDDAMAVVSMTKRLVSHDRTGASMGGKGGAAFDTDLMRRSRDTGPIGSAMNGIRIMRSAMADGDRFSDAAKKGAREYVNSRKKSVIGGAFYGAADAVKVARSTHGSTGAKAKYVLKRAGNGAMKGAKEHLVQTMDPSYSVEKARKSKERENHQSGGGGYGQPRRRKSSQNSDESRYKSGKSSAYSHHKNSTRAYGKERLYTAEQVYSDDDAYSTKSEPSFSSSQGEGREQNAKKASQADSPVQFEKSEGASGETKNSSQSERTEKTGKSQRNNPEDGAEKKVKRHKTHEKQTKEDNTDDSYSASKPAAPNDDANPSVPEKKYTNQESVDPAIKPVRGPESADTTNVASLPMNEDKNDPGASETSTEGKETGGSSQQTRYSTSEGRTSREEQHSRKLPQPKNMNNNRHRVNPEEASDQDIIHPVDSSTPVEASSTKTSGPVVSQSSGSETDAVPLNEAEKQMTAEENITKVELDNPNPKVQTSEMKESSVKPSDSKENEQPVNSETSTNRTAGNRTEEKFENNESSAQNSSDFIHPAKVRLKEYNPGQDKGKGPNAKKQNMPRTPKNKKNTGKPKRNIPM